VARGTDGLHDGEVSRRRRAAAGLIAAAASLAGARVGVQLVDGVTDPVAAMGRLVVDRAPGPAREVTIRTVGTADKPLLLLAITAVVLALGAGIGLLNRRARISTAAALWGVGTAALVAVPGSSPAADLVVAVGAPVVGALVLDLLLPRTATGSYAPGRPTGPLHPEGMSRRRFLRRSAAVLSLVAAATGAGAALAAGTARVRRTALPTARRRAVRPAALAAPAGRTPLVTTAASLYRVDTALQTPDVDPDRWRLAISGLVERPRTLGLADVMAMPQVEAWITLGCVGNEVGGDLVGTALWQGVLLSDLLRTAGVAPGATQVVGRSVDGYTGAFPIWLALDGRDALLAVGMNGALLPREHGYPARLVVPGLYGYESAVKWLAEIELADDRYRAYWVRRGYARSAEFRTQSRIDVPADGAAVGPGALRVAGMAWAPHRGISRVEVQVDTGPWRAARLEPDQLGVDGWRPWWAELTPAPGEHTVAVRAVDGRGDAQPARRHGALPDGATGHHRVRIVVAE